MTTQNGFYIGGANPETVRALSETVMAVLLAPHADERTKQMALKVLSKGVEAPSNTQIHGCNATSHHHEATAEPTTVIRGDEKTPDLRGDAE